jgi:hypothetical protein
VGGERRKKLITPDDPHWFVLFLCSRWGKSLTEIESMPISELNEHRWFHDNYKWGMHDDLLAMQLTHSIKTVNHKSSVQPWMVKSWTTQRDYTYRLQRLITKPVTAIRSGFFAVVNAIKGMKNGN